MNIRIASLAAILVFGAGLGASQALAADPTVATTSGPVVGESAHGVAAFKGVPFAAPPLGALRWRAPQPPAAWTAPRDAKAYGPDCMQNPFPGDAAPLGVQPAEDCLYMNVWAPEAALKSKTQRPVMVWIYGGGFVNGGSSPAVYAGDRFARDGVVLGSFNYRVGRFGFFAHPALTAVGADGGMLGNYGLMDQIAALKWVRDNIAAFGGDPGNILVFGQSGGGAKIATMMAMPAAAGLFHRAITMSGQQVTASGPLNATKRAQAYLARLGVKADDLSSLLSRSTAQLVEGLAAQDPILGGGLYMGPVLDMTHLARHPFWPDAPPQSQAIPMMLGNTHDETRAFIDPDGPRLKGLDWSNLAARIAPELRMDLSPEWIVAQYRARYPDWSAERIFYAATTAGRSWPGQVLEAEARARGDAPTWVYQVDFASPTQPERGAPHTMDIALALGTLDAPGSFTGTGAGAQAASRALMQRFLAFARRGDPNGSGMAPWPQYRLDRRQTMIVDVDSHVESDPRGWERELFARVPYIQPGS